MRQGDGNMNRIKEFLSSLWNPRQSWGEIDPDMVMVWFVRILLISVAASILIGAGKIAAMFYGCK